MANPHSTRAALPCAILACIFSASTFANPTGPVVVNGTASFATSGPTLSVTNSPSAIINWQNFSIGAGEITRFTQQTAASAVLNRVISQNPSAILGALESNGRVFLLNPNGIVFGVGSRVDVAGLVAATLGLSDADFLAGRFRFTTGGGIVFQGGSITTPPGGQVYLVGGQVINTGQISAPNGEVVLAAGESVELLDPATPNLRVEITATNQQVVNIGQITADAGRIGIFAGLIDHIGTLSANTAVATEDGRVLLRATGNIRLVPGSTVSATGPGTGDIQIQSIAGDVTVSGAGILVDPLRGNVGIVSVTRESGTPFAPESLFTFGTTDLSLLATGETTGLSGGSFGITSGAAQDSAPFASTVPTLSTSVPTLITGVPTLTSSVPAPTASFFTLNQASTPTEGATSTSVQSTTGFGTGMTAPLGTVRTESMLLGR